jgi:hypothetical protein
LIIATENILGAKMAVYKTNFEVIYADKEEVAIYYQAATNKINLLLKNYNIRDANGNLEKVSTDNLQALLSFEGFFESTPLKAIFYDQKQQYVPDEIVYQFQSIISNSPVNIKAVFFETFITLLAKRGWDKPLSEYFETQYNFPSDGIIILDDLKDFSVGFGVYKATFQLRAIHHEKVTVFLKKSNDTRSYNELLYFHLQKKLLPTARYAEKPYLLLNKENNEALLLSPLVPGVTSDTALSILTQAYRTVENSYHKAILKLALEILIEAFISHAVLGDLLGRNDRHLMNSLIAFIVDGNLQNTPVEDLISSEKMLAYAQNIVTNQTKAISLIDIDLKWLLGENNDSWALADIDFGLSELNLLSLLPEFNDYNSNTNLFFEKRKDYIAHYFNKYCQQLEDILVKKELLIFAINKMYPSDISKQKIKFLTKRINCFDKNKKPIIKLFKRYLLNYRLRLVHKETLAALNSIANESNYSELLSALNATKLSQYLPAWPTVISSESSVFPQLQCFRGVLAQKDLDVLSENNRTAWETVAENISMIAEKYNSNLFKVLEDKKKFIIKDTAAILKFFSKHMAV